MYSGIIPQAILDSDLSCTQWLRFGPPTRFRIWYGSSVFSRPSFQPSFNPSAKLVPIFLDTPSWGPKPPTLDKIGLLPAALHMLGESGQAVIAFRGTEVGRFEAAKVDDDLLQSDAGVDHPYLEGVVAG